MIRPERVGVEPAGADGLNRLPGLIEHSVFLGSFRELRVRILGGSLIKVVLPNDGTPLAYEQGAAVTLHLPSDALRVLRDSAARARAPARTRRRAGSRRGTRSGEGGGPRWQLKPPSSRSTASASRS